MDRSRSRQPGAGSKSPRLLGMRKLNGIVLLAGVVAVLFGYVLLDRGSVTAAPILLVAGYAVLIPAGLLIGFGGNGGTGGERDTPEGE